MLVCCIAAAVLAAKVQCCV